VIRLSHPHIFSCLLASKRLISFFSPTYYHDCLSQFKKAEADTENQGYKVCVAESAQEVAAACNLIITATPAKKPLLYSKDIQPGTHIRAVRADTPEKQELESKILTRAEVVVVDSRSQAQSRGEVYQALRQGVLSIAKTVELGEIILQPELRRQTNNQLTVADLTGVAVQDIQIAKAVHEKYLEE